MNPRIRNLAIAAVVIFVFIIIGGYFLSKTVFKSNPTPYRDEPVGTTTLGQVSSTTIAVDTSDTSAWKLFEDLELGISLKYPNTWKQLTHTVKGVTFEMNNSVADTAIGQNTIKGITSGVTIASGGCRVDAQATLVENDSVAVNGIVFAHTFGIDNGAGNSYSTEMFRTTQLGSCYSLFIRYDVVNPANYNFSAEQLASVSVNNSATERYIRNIFKTVVLGFRFAVTPDGQNEGEVSKVRIDSVSPMEAPIGSILTLVGANFSGHDTLLWISATGGTAPLEKGVLWGVMPTSDTKINTIINGSVCHEYTGASGLPCSGTMKIVPGTYTLTVENALGKSNEAYIKIK